MLWDGVGDVGSCYLLVYTSGGLSFDGKDILPASTSPTCHLAGLMFREWTMQLAVHDLPWNP